MDNREKWYIEQTLLHTDRMNKRMFVIILLLVVALLGSNAGWIYYESQFKTTETEVEQDVAWNDGNDVIVNGTGEVDINGRESETNN